MPYQDRPLLPKFSRAPTKDEWKSMRVSSYRSKGFKRLVTLAAYVFNRFVHPLRPKDVD